MFRHWRERLALLVDRRWLLVSFTLTVSGILLGCLEVMTVNVSSGLDGGIVALIGLVGMAVSLPFHQREPRRPLFDA
jgi:hypothetical protein